MAACRPTAPRLSGGIVLKSEELGTDDWLRALGEALAHPGAAQPVNRQALERLLNG